MDSHTRCTLRGWLIGMLVILLLPPIGIAKAADLSADDILDLLEGAESTYGNMSLEYEIEDITESDSASSYTQLLLNKYKSEPRLAEWKAQLQEYAEGLGQTNLKRTHVFKARLGRISQGKGFCHYVQQYYRKAGEAQLHLSRIESFDGEVYREYYPGAKTGIIDNVPLLTATYALPIEYILCVSATPLSNFIRSNVSGSIREDNGTYVLGCEKRGEETEYQGKKILTTNIVKFYLDTQKGFLPAKIEIGERLTHAGRVKWENVPETLYELRLKKYEGGIWFPETITTSYFKWFPDESGGSGTWKKFYKGQRRVVKTLALRPDPEATKETYSLEFPAGASISDRILRIHYVQGR